jgi:pyruvate, water dikinase
MIRLPLRLLLAFFLGLTLAGAGCADQKPRTQPAAKDPDSLPALRSKADFMLLAGPPLTLKYGAMRSVKVVLDLPDSALYYVHSRRYPLHYDFSAQQLGFRAGQVLYNQWNYSQSKLRRFVLGTLNQFGGGGYALEFFPMDDISGAQMAMLYRRVRATVPTPDSVRVLVSTPEQERRLREAAPAVPRLTPDQAYQAQTFQPLVAARAYGYLRRVPHDSVLAAGLGPNDILLTDGSPPDLPPVAGLLTTAFQTPLSHLNLLSQNRGTPFAAWRGAWVDAGLLNFTGQLVRLTVTADTFRIEPAKLADAQAAWATRNQAPLRALRLDVRPHGLVDLTKAAYGDVKLIGGKAANFSELLKVEVSRNEPLPVPEGAFAIPFCFYWQHVERNGIRAALDSLWTDAGAMADSRRLTARLRLIQARIRRAPLDPALVRLIEARVKEKGLNPRLRFRSSTNAEDIEGFNGAGLYDSQTGVIGRPDSARKSVAQAIRTVWASLWEPRAVQERQLYHLDQRTVAMGVLVHRSFPEEAVNGVALTRNVYNNFNAGYVVNVQVGETSVVKPPPGVRCDQLIVYDVLRLPFSHSPAFPVTAEYLDRSNQTTNAQPVMTDAEIRRLADCLAALKRHYHQHVSGSWSGLPYDELALDVEFKLDGPERKLYIKQARPLVGTGVTPR